MREDKYLQARYRILSALSSATPRGFNELQRTAGVSTRTLDKHLKRLAPKAVEKVNGKYRITDAGIREREKIQQQLRESASRRGRFAGEVVRVTFVEPYRSWRGRLIVYSPRKLGRDDHSVLDNALTTAMRTIRSEIPPRFEGGRVHIGWAPQKAASHRRLRTRSVNVIRNKNGHV